MDCTVRCVGKFENWSVETFVPAVLEDTSTFAPAVSVTLTSAEAPAGRKVTATEEVLLKLTSTLGCSKAANPCAASTCTLYMPGGRLRMRYCPESSVTVDCGLIRFGLVTLMVAPGMT